MQPRFCTEAYPDRLDSSEVSCNLARNRASSEVPDTVDTVSTSKGDLWVIWPKVDNTELPPGSLLCDGPASSRVNRRGTSELNPGVTSVQLTIYSQLHHHPRRPKQRKLVVTTKLARLFRRR